MKLNPDLFTDKEKKTATRDGFGEGILEAGSKDKNIVCLAADLASSLKLGEFIKKFPNRFIQVGVAEQNLVTVASGLSHVGKIPFCCSFAAFSPGRNWEQIKTTICYNNQPVKIIGGHTGLGVGEDGATHQMLEDIAIMRVIPNIEVIVPCDSVQAKQATLAIAKSKRPTYLRLTRNTVPIMTLENEKFEIGKAQTFKDGTDICIVGCGPILYECLKAANMLEKENIHAMVINMHTIKPLDEVALLIAAQKTKLMLTVEDHQVEGGLGGAVCEALSTAAPMRIDRMGMHSFGDSGKDSVLYEEFHLVAQDIYDKVKNMLSK